MTKDEYLLKLSMRLRKGHVSTAQI